MKVVTAAVPGGPEVMVMEERDPPAPGPGQARVAVAAAGVNFIDVYFRTGVYPAPRPIPLGQEGAGTVDAVGDGVDLQPGQRVAWTGLPGSYATHLVAPADRLVPLPDGIDFRTAAAAMLQGMTAHYLTRSTFALGAGHTCLVHAAAGGVGLLLCQLGRRAGARVIGTVSTEAKAAEARAAGAAETINYREVDFEPEVRRLTGGRGVDVVYDSVGADTYERSLRCLRPRGLLGLFGQSSGPVPPFAIQLLNRAGSAFLTRPNLAHYVASRAELLERAGEVLAWVAAGDLTLTIAAELPLARAADAHRLLESRKTTGKLLLIP
ncbi:MAG TPA: quinone oxidoreductase [Kofleriaceae bacterium]|nr:quinone oxidoreductase [Kofleriaceae bacterium]